MEEPFGMVAVEAIASGRWVVASGVGGLRDIVMDGVNGGPWWADGDFAGALVRVPGLRPGRRGRHGGPVQPGVRWQAELARIWEELTAA